MLSPFCYGYILVGFLLIIILYYIRRNLYYTMFPTSRVIILVVYFHSASGVGAWYGGVWWRCLGSAYQACDISASAQPLTMSSISIFVSGASWVQIRSGCSNILHRRCLRGSFDVFLGGFSGIGQVSQRCLRSSAYCQLGTIRCTVTWYLPT